MSVSSYTQGHDTATLRSHQTRSAEKQADYLLRHIKEDDHILDVGCGPGTITCSLAKYVPQRRVAGVDDSPGVLEQARREGQCIAMHCSSIYPKAVDALKEVVRVCKIGGYIAAREPDIETCVIHPHSSPIERWHAIRARLLRSERANPNAGRPLAEWAIAAGLNPSTINVTRNVLEHFGAGERRFWGEIYKLRLNEELTRRAVDSGFMASDEVEQIAAAYPEWSQSNCGIWAMMHMRLLAQG